jgi:hypothetical protein
MGGPEEERVNLGLELLQQLGSPVAEARAQTAPNAPW